MHLAPSQRLVGCARLGDVMRFVDLLPCFDIVDKRVESQSVLGIKTIRTETSSKCQAMQLEIKGCGEKG